MTTKKPGGNIKTRHVVPDEVLVKGVIEKLHVYKISQHINQHNI
jgi:hypothetical protein